jgi:rhamnosyltransferase
MPPAPDAMHAVVMPLFGESEADLGSYLLALQYSGLEVVLVDNDPCGVATPPGGLPCRRWIPNRNRGGIAGGLNRGVAAALELGAGWITLLDQDSRLDAEDLHRLREPWSASPSEALVVGPRIWDRERQELHGRGLGPSDAFERTRLLISSGTTFRAEDWPALGGFHEGLFIDFVDHAWCFRAQSQGFELLQHSEVRLEQRFGSPHPNRLCRWAGLQLYSPQRHYYAIRNLRWLILQKTVPLDLKLKECVKMLIKPWCWLLFEPKRLENLNQVLRGLIDTLPDPYR